MRFAANFKRAPLVPVRKRSFSSRLTGGIQVSIRPVFTAPIITIVPPAVSHHCQCMSRLKIMFFFSSLIAYIRYCNQLSLRREVVHGSRVSFFPERTGSVLVPREGGGVYKRYVTTVAVGGFP